LYFLTQPKQLWQAQPLQKIDCLCAMNLTIPTLPEFDAPDLAIRIEAMTVEQINALPFGVIRVDVEGVVRQYSAREAALSGFGARDAIGLEFFAQMAPCMNSPLVRGRIEKALAQRTLDMRMSHVGDFTDRQRLLDLRAVSATQGGFWLFLRRV
jgi:photoactive yellow protein